MKRITILALAALALTGCGSPSPPYLSEARWKATGIIPEIHGPSETVAGEVCVFGPDDGLVNYHMSDQECLKVKGFRPPFISRW